MADRLSHEQVSLLISIILVAIPDRCGFDESCLLVDEEERFNFARKSSSAFACRVYKSKLPGPVLIQRGVKDFLNRL